MRPTQIFAWYLFTVPAAYPDQKSVRNVRAHREMVIHIERTRFLVFGRLVTDDSRPKISRISRNMPAYESVLSGFIVKKLTSKSYRQKAMSKSYRSDAVGSVCAGSSLKTACKDNTQTRQGWISNGHHWIPRPPLVPLATNGSRDTYATNNTAVTEATEGVTSFAFDDMSALRFKLIDPSRLWTVLLKKEVVQAQRFSNEWSRDTETCTSVEHKKATTKTIRWSWSCTDKKRGSRPSSENKLPKKPRICC